MVYPYIRILLSNNDELLVSAIIWMKIYFLKLGMKEPDTHRIIFLYDVLEQTKVIYRARKQNNCLLQLALGE